MEAGQELVAAAAWPEWSLSLCRQQLLSSAVQALAAGTSHELLASLAVMSYTRALFPRPFSLQLSENKSTCE